jgi:hypothetical protein
LVREKFGFGTQVKSASLFAVPAEIFPPSVVATVWGVSGAAGSLACAERRDDYIIARRPAGGPPK